MKLGASDELYFGSLRNIKIMIYVCTYIVSFVVKSPSGGKNTWKTAPSNPRRSLFEKCFKSWFDTVRWWEMSCAFEIFRNYWFRCILRRVMVIFRQQKNFGPNVRYCVLGYHFWLSPWSSIDHVTSHSRVVALLNLSLFLRIIRSLYKNKTLGEWLVTWYSGPYWAEPGINWKLPYLLMNLRIF